jgi:hypothetical protein
MFKCAIVYCNYRISILSCHRFQLQRSTKNEIQYNAAKRIVIYITNAVGYILQRKVFILKHDLEAAVF